jgi:hypothetical protein
MSTAAGDWCDGEERTRDGMVAELQRFKRRAQTRPWPIVITSLLLSALVTWWVVHKPRLVEADVTLAITEGSLGGRRMTLPVDQLRAYVETVLLTDTRLGELVERRDLFPLRKKLGLQYAIGELRDQLEITVFRNTFLYDDADVGGPRSARVQLTITDHDPDRAVELARAVADIAIATTEEHRQRFAAQLGAAVARVRDGLAARLAELDRQLATHQADRDAARAAHDVGRESAIAVELAAIAHAHKRAEDQLARSAASADGLASQIAAAGLDTRVEIVEEDRPDPPAPHGALIAGLAIIVFVLGLVIMTVVYGAFDSRIHDDDDVARLGLPVLGAMPGFPGDGIGSLRARGLAPARRFERR